MLPAPDCLEDDDAPSGVALSTQDRRALARALSTASDAAGLAACLMEERAPAVRAALFDGMAALGGAARVAGALALLPCLGSADAGLRNGAVAALKAMGADAAAALDDALDETRSGARSDVRLLAVEVLRAWPPALALSRLQHVLLHDAHVNVCAAAAEVAAERGAPALAPALLALRRRFADHPFIQFCAQVALTRIGDETAAAPVATPRDVDLQKFIELFYRRTGVRFAENRSYYVARELAAQAAAAGWDATAYIAWLTTTQPAAELAALLARFCPPRSAFFAPDALPAGLAAAVARADATLPVWVLAGDAGQTACSLALYAQETEWPLEVMAELSPAALAAAGRYDRAALAGLDPALARLWFTGADGGPLIDDAPAAAAAVIDLWGEPAAVAAPVAAPAGPVLLRPALRALVAHLPRGALPAGGVGLIHCEHVLPYESEAARGLLAAQLYDALCPGGYLSLGASETLSRASGLFTVIPRDGGVIFQKPRDRTERMRR